MAMIKRRAIWIFSGLTFAFLFAPAPAQEKAQEKAWTPAVNAGGEAMEKHECEEAERLFKDADSVAGGLKHGKKYAQFPAAMLLVAQACNPQGKRDEPQAEMLAQRAADGM